jgi:hypothetical protein
MSVPPVFLRTARKAFVLTAAGVLLFVFTLVGRAWVDEGGMRWLLIAALLLTFAGTAYAMSALAMARRLRERGGGRDSRS